MAPLSTTALIGQLNQGKFRDFVDVVQQHFYNEDTDDVSALKVIKTVAAFVYQKEIAIDVIEDVVKIVKTCVDVIINKEDVSDLSLKELFGNITHVMNRLVKQEQTNSIATLASSFFRISDKMMNKETLQNMAYNVYVMVWNFAFKLEPDMKLESEVSNLVNILFYALKFLILVHKSDKFSLCKLVDKVMSSTRLVLKKDSSKSICDLLSVKLFEIIANPVMDEGDQRWEICSFMVDIFTKYRVSKLFEILGEVEKVLGPSYSGEVEYLQFITQLAESTSHSTELLAVSPSAIKPTSLASLLSLVDGVVSTCSSLPSSLLPSTCSTLMLLTKMATPNTAMVASRVVCSLTSWVLKAIKLNSPTPQLVSLSISLVSDNSNCLALLPSNTDSKFIKSCSSSLTMNSFNLSVVLYNVKLFFPCLQLLQTSCDSCQVWAKLDPGRASSLRPRLKLLAEVFFKLGQFRECLKMYSNSLVVQLTYETDESMQVDKMAEAGKFWIGVKREWVIAEPDNNIVHTVSIMSLLEEGMVHGISPPTPALLCRLGRLEIGWHRLAHHGPCDLTQSWVSTAGTLLRLSNNAMDRGMVLLEQAWVFWLGDNTEDLEMGAKCAEKAVGLLAGEQLEGLAWYWRFMCEHRLLMVQVQGAMERVGEDKKMGRKEKEGLGEEEQETEPTPAFPGLEMSVQTKLMEFLEKAVEVWENKEYLVGDWMGGKIMLQFMMATAWEMERMGHSGVKAFRLVKNLGLRLGELEETVLAVVELVRMESEEDLGELIRLGRELELKNSNSASACQVGLALAHRAMVSGEGEIAREMVGELINSGIVRQNSLKCNLVGSEARLLGSILRVEIGECMEMNKHGLSDHGPLFLALEAWKLAVLCYKWWEQDVRTPSSQDPALLWIGPRLATLQLRCVDQLASLFRQISAPRELKCYLKEGLKAAQWQCLPLRTANLLVSLAEAHLLCDDEVAASVQLDGVRFVLSSVVEQMKEKKIKNQREVDNCQVVKLPGQDDQSMSPALARQQYSPPPFLNHPVTCSCHLCHLPLLHRTILTSTFTQAWCMAVEGMMETASTLYNMGKAMYPSILLKSKAIANNLLLPPSTFCHQLSQEHLACLIQEGECWAWHSNWRITKQVVKVREEVIMSVPEQLLKAHPALLLSHFEQRSSLAAARERKEKIEEEIKEIEAEVLTKRLQKLELTESSASSNTPIAVLPSSNQSLGNRNLEGAPHKRVIPSLGLGDPASLAKKLDKTLSLVTEVDEDQPKLVGRTIRRGPVRPRLFSAADLISSNIKKVVPKLVLTKDTPRRFFKSKGSSSDPVVSTPDVGCPPPLTPSGTSIKVTCQSNQKPKLPAPPEEQQKQATVKKSISSRSLEKENVYEIFEDDTMVTPIPVTKKTTTRSRTSARKATLSSACDDSLVTKSVSKPPRMSKLSEAEPATRSSARRKVALKRL